MLSKLKKFFYPFVSISILVFLFFNAYLYTNQPNIVFYPSDDVDVSPKDWGLPFEKISLNTKTNQKISGWFLPHPQANKTVLFFHGNGGNISHRGDSIYIFHKLKLNVLIIDYVGYGDSEGIPSEKGLYQSADAAWQYLVSNEKIEPKNIIIFGRSLGGAVAVNLASRVKAGGLILESTFSSVRDLVEIAFPMLSPFIYLRYSFDSLSKIKNISIPTLVIHSPDDGVIPFELGVKLFKKLNTEKDFLQIRGSHNDGFMQSASSYIPGIRSFLHSLP